MSWKLSRSARTQRGKLAVERLESKDLLAGDVMVSVVGGHLLVQGDAEANQIAVSSGAEPGSYLIAGRDGTTVSMADGSASGDQLTVEGVRGNVRIVLGEGDDAVRINDAMFRRNVTIAMGAGDDRVLIGVPAPDDGAAEAETSDEAPGAHVAIRGALTILTDGGEDVVRVGDATVGQVLSVATGADADRVVLGAEPPTTPEAAVAASTDDGDAGQAPHLLRAGGISVLLGDGDDAARLHDVGARYGASIVGGPGSDNITLSHVDAGLSLLVHGGRGEGADDIALQDVAARFAWVGTGDGADAVRIADSAFTALAVSTGAGDDTLNVSGTTARWAAFLGGPGEDTLNEGNANQFGRKLVRSFELPEAPVDSGQSRTTLLGRLLSRRR